MEEEEWSFIPVGGPMPIRDQPITAFGAAANMVHPATGFSIARSLRDAPGMADAVAAALKANLTVAEASARVWDALWPEERRRQVSGLGWVRPAACHNAEVAASNVVAVAITLRGQRRLCMQHACDTGPQPT